MLAAFPLPCDGGAPRKSSLRLARLLVFASLLVLDARVTAAEPLFLAGCQAYPTGMACIAVVAADVDGDGRLDLVAANQWPDYPWAPAPNTGTVTCMLGVPGGGFGPRSEVAAGIGVAGLAIGDFNGDGKLDAVVPNVRTATVSVLPGHGDGSFGSSITTGTARGPHAVAVADFDRDGYLDIAAACDSSNTLTLLFGVGDGTFARRRDMAVAAGPFAALAADLNGDGFADVALANRRGFVASVLYGVGDGTFASPLNLSVGADPFDIAMADINDDGIGDLAVVNRTSGTLSVLRGKPGGGFLPQVAYPTPPEPQGIAIADVDGDGRKDLVAAFQGTPGGIDGIAVLFANGSGGFGPAFEHRTGMYPLGVVATDLTGDGICDVAVASQIGYAVCVHEGLGGGILGRARSLPTYMGGTFNLETADFNADGAPDLAVMARDTVFVWLDNGDATFGIGSFYVIGNATTMDVGDVNGDGRSDIVVGSSSHLIAGVLRGNGDGTFQLLGPSTPTGLATKLQLADVDHNGALDAVMLDIFHGNLTVLKGNGQGGFSSPVIVSAGSFSGQDNLAARDLDGDGQAETIVVRGDEDGKITVFRNSAGPGADYGSMKYPRAIALGDFDEDGRLDVVVSNGFVLNQTVSTLRGFADASFGFQRDVYTGGNAEGIAVADFDGDQHLDLALSNLAGTVGILLGHGDRTFSAPLLFGAGGQDVHVVAADFNRDGYPDLALDQQNPGNGVALLLNHGAGISTPVAFSLSALDVTAERVHLEWYSPDHRGAMVRVERCVAGAWMPVGDAAEPSPGRFVFDDAAVEAGKRYGYRLGILVGEATVRSAETWVDVAAAERLALGAIEPNPARNDVALRFELPTAGPARVEIWDVAGRRVWSREVGAAGRGSHRMVVDARGLRPGLYVLRLEQNGRSVTRRLALAR